MSLFKKEEGLIFDDNFTEATSRWVLSPQSHCFFKDGCLRLAHSEVETVAMFELPLRDSLLIEVSADYIPESEGDEGGLLVWKSSTNRLDFLESMHTTTGEYAVWRAKKKGNQWYFYARKNGVWEFFDSATLDAKWAGVVLNNFSADYKDMLVNRVVVCESDSVTISNIDDTFSIELYDSGGVMLSQFGVEPDGGGVEIMLPEIPFTGSIKLYKDGNLEDIVESITMYGGDVFVYGYDLDIYWDGTQLSDVNTNYLGKLMFNELTEKMVLVNNSPFTTENISISLRQYKEDVGWEYVDIALDEAGSPGLFSDSILIGTLNPGENREFWVKITKTDFDYFCIKPAHFYVDVYHS